MSWPEDPSADFPLAFRSSSRVTLLFPPVHPHPLAPLLVSFFGVTTSSAALLSPFFDSSGFAAFVILPVLVIVLPAFFDLISSDSRLFCGGAAESLFRLLTPFNFFSLFSALVFCPFLLLPMYC